MSAALVVFVHAAQGEEQVTPDRDVARHHERSFAAAAVVLAEIQQPAEFASESLGWQVGQRCCLVLEYGTASAGDAIPAQHVSVGQEEIGTDSNIVIEEQKEIANRCSSSGIACFGGVRFALS